MASKTVFGIFSDREDATNAINRLHSQGYDAKDISIVMKDTRDTQAVADDTGANVAGGAVTGATTGVIVGGIAGLVASFLIPGLGAFFIGGPIASALGLTGAAAATASGAATGLVAGGLLGALTGLGLPEEQARHYEQRINEGGILVAVPARPDEDTEVGDVLQNAGADDIQAVTMPASEETTQENVGDYADYDDVVEYEETDTTHKPITFASNDDFASETDESYKKEQPTHRHAAGDTNDKEKTARHSHKTHASAGKAHKSTSDDHAHVSPVQVQKYLKNMEYPASKKDLLKTAKQEGADKNVLMTLDELANDEFDSPTDVSRAIGKIE